MEKYLFLYLRTGGGHLAPAKAVAERINARHKQSIQIELVDGLLESGTFIRKIIEDGYKTSVNSATWIYEFLYLINKISVISGITAALAGYFIKPGLEKFILQHRPEKIVLFHFFLIKPMFEIKIKHNLNIPIITVVTDPYTAHPIWFQQKEQNYIVFSEILKEKCIKSGIKETSLRVFPFVLDSKFSQRVGERKKLKIRMKLGFGASSRIILIIGGGEGIPKGKKILKKIIRGNMEAEIAIVCGNNIKLYASAMKLKHKYGINNLKVYGFVDFVHSLLCISDIVVTKCGASTAMEILLMGKVPVINNYIWEQEKGNMEFVCNNKFGVLERNTGFLPKILNRLLKDSAFYNSLTENIKNASIQNGVNQVSDYILNFR